MHPRALAANVACRWWSLHSVNCRCTLQRALVTARDLQNSTLQAKDPAPASVMLGDKSCKGAPSEKLCTAICRAGAAAVCILSAAAGATQLGTPAKPLPTSWYGPMKPCTCAGKILPLHDGNGPQRSPRKHAQKASMTTIHCPIPVQARPAGHSHSQNCCAAMQSPAMHPSR